jgi:hypothetical protein
MENKSNASLEMFQKCFFQNVIPAVVDQANKDLHDDGVLLHQVTKEDVLKEINISSLCIKSVHKYISYLGYQFDEQKKCYYNDGHEKPEQIMYRKIFVQKYFELDICCYVWIQIDEDEAVLLENDDKLPLMKNICYNYVQII